MNLLDFRSIIYGRPTEHDHDPIYSLSIYARFSGQFFFKKKIVMGKKDRPVVFGCNNDHLIPEKYTVKFSFCPESALNTERIPPGHPIILLKSNKFNMAAESVKRSVKFNRINYIGRLNVIVRVNVVLNRITSKLN